MALSLVPSIAQAQDFSAVNEDGVTIYYNILSEEEKTCEVTFTPMEVDDIYTGDIVIPSTANGYTVTTIGKWTFDRQELKSVNIGDGVETIMEEAFIGCTGLETLIIGKSLKTVHYSAFKDCKNISHLEINTPIVEEWFHGTSIKTVTLGDNVKEIGGGAFWMCNSLTTISIPNSVTTIGNAAFQYCSLSSIDIPNSVTSIGNMAFEGCGLTSIEIPNSVTSIGYHAFENCRFTSIDIPATVKKIGEYAFIGCEDLKYVKIGDSSYTDGCSTTIDEGAFWECSGIESLILGSSVENIGANAFEGCTALASISISNSVKTIGNTAFEGCTALTSISIPKSVTSIGTNPFANCPSLESIIVEEGNEKYNSTGDCNAIIETSSGTLIAGCANTVVPKTIKAIGGGAFSGCVGLQTVTIPSTVTSIGGAAFSNCTNLSTVYSEITDFFDIPTNVFKGSENTTLYVPKGMATTYRSSTGWSVIKYIEEMPGDTPDASFLISCSSKGFVSVNGSPSITNKIAAASINEGTDNTFTFTPKPGCRLDQVILNGLDITANVEGNTLTCTIPANSQMIVTFATEQGDMNNDGTLDISDVVSIVNKILGN